MNKVPIYNIAIEEDEFDLGLTKMSLVEYPAVNVPFLKFSENDIVKETFSTNKDKKIVTSVALLADTPIKRIDDYGNLYYVVFNKEIIGKLVNKFFKDDLIKSVNINHFEDTDKAYLIESYFVNEELGIKPKGIYSTDGSWIVSYKILDDDLWNDIKEGKLNGFSVEIQAYLEEFNSINNKFYMLSKAILNEDFKELIKLINNKND